MSYPQMIMRQYLSTWAMLKKKKLNRSFPHTHTHKKKTENFASCQKSVVCFEKYFKVFWKVMLCWLVVTYISEEHSALHLVVQGDPPKVMNCCTMCITFG